MRRHIDLIIVLNSIHIAVTRGDCDYPGICALVYQLSGSSSDRSIYRTEMRRLFESWPEFSGDWRFPIKPPPGYHTPQEAYSALHRWEGTYGEARRRLLDFMIEQLESGSRAPHPTFDYNVKVGL